MRFKNIRRKIEFLLGRSYGSTAITLLCKTLKIEVHGSEHLENLTSEGKSVLLSIWHGKILLPIYHLRNQNIAGMVSQSRDGEMIARTVERMGYLSVRGSSSSGGLEALTEMTNWLKVGGRTGAVMPDGPRGPIHKVKSGVVKISINSGAYVLPLTFASKESWVMKSWDRFRIPKPFSRNTLIYGEAIPPDRLAAMTDIRVAADYVEREMNKLEELADNYFA